MTTSFRSYKLEIIRSKVKESTTDKFLTLAIPGQNKVNLIEDSSQPGTSSASSRTPILVTRSAAVFPKTGKLRNSYQLHTHLHKQRHDKKNTLLLCLSAQRCLGLARDTVAVPNFHCVERAPSGRTSCVLDFFCQSLHVCHVVVCCTTVSPQTADLSWAATFLALQSAMRQEETGSEIKRRSMFVGSWLLRSLYARYRSTRLQNCLLRARKSRSLR